MAELPHDMKIIILAAPSGAGKTTIAHALMAELPQLTFSVSATTRPIRGSETDGQDYYFFSPEQFRTHIAEDAFVEYEEVYTDRFYGTLRSELARIHAAGKVPIFDVDVKGALNLKQQFGDNALNVFIDPPSLDALELRLRSRGTDSEADIERRMQRARYELSQIHHFDHVIPNYDLDNAVAKALNLIWGFLSK